MNKKKNYVLESFVVFLEDNLEGYSGYSARVRFNLAWLLYNFNRKKRQHKKGDEYASISYQQLDQSFGRRKFHGINEHLGLFIVSENWSHEKKETRTYILTDKAKQLIKDFTDTDPIISHFLNEAGNRVRSFPQNHIDISPAISLMQKSTRHAKVGISPFVPINLEALNELIASLRQLERDFSLKSTTLEIAEKIRHNSYNKNHKGAVLQYYDEIKTGRYYGVGLNFQNIPRVITDACLDGCYEYDFENCHYSILSQLANRYGLETPIIDYYLSHKEQVRETLATEIGLSVKQAKTCLIAVIYGATRSLNEERAAIAHEITAVKAERLFANTFFSKLMDEVSAARKVVLKKWDNTTQRMYVNAVGKKISKKENPRHILAHLLQGIESQMLRIAVRLYSDRIVLLMHDGFSTSEPIDVDFLLREIAKVTGFSVRAQTSIHQWKSNTTKEVLTSKVLGVSSGKSMKQKKKITQNSMQKIVSSF